MDCERISFEAGWEHKSNSSDNLCTKTEVLDRNPVVSAFEFAKQQNNAVHFAALTAAQFSLPSWQWPWRMHNAVPG